jgi:hypothetical protein
MDEIISKFNMLGMDTAIEHAEIKSEMPEPVVNTYAKQKLPSSLLNFFPELLHYELYLNTDCYSLQYAIFMALIPDFHIMNTTEKQCIMRKFIEHDLSEETTIKFILSCYYSMNIIIVTKNKINYLFNNSDKTILLYRSKKVYYSIKKIGRLDRFFVNSGDDLIIKLMSVKWNHSDAIIPHKCAIPEMHQEIKHDEIAPTKSLFANTFDDVSIILDNQSYSHKTKNTRLMRLKADILKYACATRGLLDNVRVPLKKKDLCNLLITA